MTLPLERAGRLLILLLVCAIIAACQHQEPSSAQRAPTIVLVVLDTVRRDRVQPCGYPLPTTPNLVKLAARGTTFCGMVAPGSWTLPVHASIFTGRIPTDHGADFAPDGAPVPGLEVLSVASLPPELPTLGEQFRDVGYQTVLVSGNPVLHPSIGLARGFELIHVASEFGLGPAADIYPAAERILTGGEIDRSTPLFLFVNIATAHGPFERVPAAVDWLPETREVIDLFRPLPKPLFWRFHTGAMETHEEDAFLADLRAAYDWGVRLADDALGRILFLLEREGWLDDRSLIAITSAHGELLGEHHLLDHGRTVV
ncbi:MAG: sulfatase-like hydrolase/transferase, partial [Planctomycetota bacterium]